MVEVKLLSGRFKQYSGEITSIYGGANPVTSGDFLMSTGQKIPLNAAGEKLVFVFCDIQVTDGITAYYKSFDKWFVEFVLNPQTTNPLNSLFSGPIFAPPNGFGVGGTGWVTSANNVNTVMCTKDQPQAFVPAAPVFGFTFFLRAFYADFASITTPNVRFRFQLVTEY